MQSAAAITAYFEGDHMRLDQVFNAFRKKKKESMEEARPLFRTFVNGLKRHIIWEEDVLFPLFEAKSGMKDSGPTFVMRQEHREIGALLERIHNRVRQGDASGDEDEQALLDVLGAHNGKEEQVLYPAMDRFLSEDETAAAFRAMEEIPAERYEACCGGAHHHS